MEKIGKRSREKSLSVSVVEAEPTRKVKVGITTTRKRSQELELKHLSASNVQSKDEEEEDPKVTEGAFTNFRINPKTQALLQKRGINYLFPIQSKTFDVAFDGFDIVGRDRTGSGKTLAYALPIVEKFRSEGVFSKSDGLPKLLILVPTRELATQGRVD